MNITDLANYRQLCTRGKPASCSRLCPFGFDVSQFLQKIAENDFTGAYQFYAKTVLFPRIVSALCDAPCKNECPYQLDIPKLERACIQGQTDYKLLKLPSRKAHIAITNASLAGMAAALILSQRGWNVDLFTAETQLGEGISSYLPNDITEPDFAIISKSRIRVFYETDFPPHTEYDYVYDPQVIHNVHQIAKGIRDAEQIEKALKLKQTPVLTSDAANADNVFSLPDKQKDFSITDFSVPDMDGCVKEAALCNGCQCTICIDQCAMMKHYQRTPDQLFPDLISTLGLINIQTRRIAQKHIFSCLSCGLCECPETINLLDMFRSSRRIINREGKMPPAYHEFWLKDMEHANFEMLHLSPIEKPQYIFFPGCQLGASRPEYVKDTWKLLQNLLDHVALYTGCCGAPADWAGDEPRLNAVRNQFLDLWNEWDSPVILWTCPNCAKQLQDFIPQEKLLSVYEIFDEKLPALVDCDIIAEQPFLTAAVFDPCAAAKMPDVKKSVRSLAQKAGYVLSASPSSRCCGNGGHIQAVAPEMFEETAAGAAFSSDGDFITYCANCRDIFAFHGKRAAHILDLLPWEQLIYDQSKNDPFDRPAPALGERRRNRERVIAMINGDTYMETHKQLTISDDLKTRMQKELLLEQEVLETIEFCEQTGQKLRCSDKASFIGHKQIGSITIWAQWSVTPKGYLLHNVYSHRMTILESNVSETEDANG